MPHIHTHTHIHILTYTPHLPSFISIYANNHLKLHLKGHQGNYIGKEHFKCHPEYITTTNNNNNNNNKICDKEFLNQVYNTACQQFLYKVKRVKDLGN